MGLDQIRGVISNVRVMESAMSRLVMVARSPRQAFVARGLYLLDLQTRASVGTSENVDVERALCALRKHRHVRK